VAAFIVRRNVFINNLDGLVKNPSAVFGFFNVCTIRLRRLLLAASLSFESEIV
jgi:hypothetical protein